MSKQIENQRIKIQPGTTEETVRPRITQSEKLKKLAEEMRSSPTSIVNFLVDTGIEVLNRSKDEIKREYGKKLTKILRQGLRKKR